MKSEKKHLPLQGMFREIISSTIKEKGITQRELADAIGVLPPNLNAFLKGGTLPIDNIEKALQYLGLEIVKKKASSITVVQNGKEVELPIKSINLEL